MADDKYDVLLDFVADTGQAEQKTKSFADTLKDVGDALERGEKIGARAGKASSDNWTRQRKAVGDFTAAMHASNKEQGELLKQQRLRQEALVVQRREEGKVLFQKQQEEIVVKRSAEKAAQQAKQEAQRTVLAEKQRVEAEQLAIIQKQIAEDFNREAVARKAELDIARELARVDESRKTQVTGTGITAGLPGIDPELAQQAEYITVAAKEMGVEFKQSFAELVRGGKTGEEALQSLTDQFKEMFAQTAQGQEMIRQQQIQTHQQRARFLRTEAAALNAQVAEQRRAIEGLRRTSTSLAQISRVGLGLGVGVVGGIFAFAAKYVRDAKESTAVTLQWKAAQESLARSSSRVGAIVARESLPLLLRAVTIAEKVAGFVERNPEVVKAGINIGLVTAGVSVLGILASQGIKLVADIKYLASLPLAMQAARLNVLAANEMLAAARLNATGSGLGVGGKAATGGGLLAGGAIATISASIIGALAGGFAADKAFDAIEGRDFKAEDYVVELKQMTALFAKGIGDIITNFGGASDLGMKWFEKVATGLGLLSNNLDKLNIAIPTGVRASPEFENVLKAYEGYLNEQKEQDAKYASDRIKINADANTAVLRANAKLATDIAKEIRQRDSEIAKANQNFAKSEAKAELDYSQERQKIVREGGEELAKIEQDLQETLRKNRIEHEGREEELLAARDAVGLIKERQRFNQQQSEATRDANLEVRQRRADLAQRLEDLRVSYEQERVQRLADHQARILEIQETSKAQISEMRTQHTAELREIQLNKINRIKELDSQFAEERKRSYSQFIQKIRDLDASLLGEKQLRERYYAQMTTDLDKFLAGYRTRLASIGNIKTPGGLAAGGYANYGTYLLGDRAGGGRGKREYVLGGDITELAERVLGGNLSQSKIAALLNSMGGGNQKNVVYNDGRRIDSRVSNADRNRLREDTLEAISQALGVN